MVTVSRLLQGLLGILSIVLITGCSGGDASNQQSSVKQMVSRTLVGIEVTPGKPAIAMDTTVHLVAMGTFSDNSKQDITSSVTWASSNVAAATVSNSTGSAGVASAVAQGSTTITATYGTVSGSTDLTVTSATLMSIAVTPANPKVAFGVPKQLTAMGILSDSTLQDLTNEVVWDSSNPAVATMNSAVKPSGLVTTVAPGSAIISATLGAKSGNTVLTVTSATLVSIDLTPAIPVIAFGTSQQFVATGTFSDDTIEDLTAFAKWTSSKTATASVSNTGLANGLTAGTTTISAEFGGISGSTDLTVTSATLESIDLNLDYASTPIGVPQQCTASGNFSDGSVQDLTSQASWSSSNGDVAKVSNASGSNGLVVSLGAGATSISATFGGVSGDTTLTVTSASIVSLATTPASAKIALGTNLQFSATATASDGQTFELTPYVTWTSSDLAVATLSNAAPTNGIATSVGIGSTAVKAAWGGMVSTSNLTVASAIITSMAITPTDTVSHLGAPQQMTAVAVFTDSAGNSWPQDLTTQVTWKSSARSVVLISNAAELRGLATPLKVGTVTITAVFDGSVASTTMTVSSAHLTGITITPADITIAVDNKLQLLATGSYADGYTGDITRTVRWSSSDKSIATVLNNPRKRRALLRGVSTGTATITAALRGISDRTTVTVK